MNPKTKGWQEAMRLTFKTIPEEIFLKCFNDINMNRVNITILKYKIIFAV